VERRLRAVPGYAVAPTLSIAEVERRLLDLAGRATRPRAGKSDLRHPARAVASGEVTWRRTLREMRTGAGEGIMIDALALLAGGDRASVARALQIEGDVAAVAERVLAARGRPLAASAIAYFRPLRPMLAQTAATATEALARLGGRAGVEEKLDGARVQVHRPGDTVRLYSRRLQEMTPSLPDVVAHLLDGLAVPAAILEGEVLPVDDAGRPLPFQELMRRFRRVKDVSRLVREAGGAAALDALQVGETPLIDRPYAGGWDALEAARGRVATSRADRRGTTRRNASSRRARRRARGGHGRKDLAAPYTPGIRGGRVSRRARRERRPRSSPPTAAMGGGAAGSATTTSPRATSRPAPWSPSADVQGAHGRRARAHDRAPRGARP
jgi:DNA ligase-1